MVKITGGYCKNYRNEAVKITAFNAVKITLLNAVKITVFHLDKIHTH